MEQGRFRLSPVTWILMGGLLASPATDAQVYRWTDENGVTHFSQTPPPEGQEAEVRDVLESDPEPGSGNAPAGIDFDGGADGGGQELSAADLRRQELAQAREEKRAQRAELRALCETSRSRLAQIEPSRRVFYINEEGQTVRMDDEERVSEVEELREFIDDNCR